MLAKPSVWAVMPSTSIWVALWMAPTLRTVPSTTHSIVPLLHMECIIYWLKATLPMTSWDTPSLWSVCVIC